MSDGLREEIEREMRATNKGYYGGLDVVLVARAVAVCEQMVREERAKHEAHAQAMHGCVGIATCGQEDSGLSGEEVFAPQAAAAEPYNPADDPNVSIPGLTRDRHVAACLCHGPEGCSGLDGDDSDCQGHNDSRCAPQPAPPDADDPWLRPCPECGYDAGHRESCPAYCGTQPEIHADDCDCNTFGAGTSCKLARVRAAAPEADERCPTCGSSNPKRMDPECWRRAFETGPGDKDLEPDAFHSQARKPEETR